MTDAALMTSEHPPVHSLARRTENTFTTLVNCLIKKKRFRPITFYVTSTISDTSFVRHVGTPISPTNINQSVLQSGAGHMRRYFETYSQQTVELNITE